MSIFDANVDSLCFSGGGTKGIAFIGAIECLIEKNIIKMNDIDNFIGSSAGSVISFLLCIGYLPSELNDFILEFDFNVLEPTIDSNNLFIGYGIDDGYKFIYLLRMLLKEKLGKENITFKELFDITKKKLIITVTSISTSNIKYLSYTTSPDHDVILAIRMSVSIPFYYMPVKYNDEYFIDGGILDNYPIQLGTKDKTIGLVVNSDNNIDVNDFSDYLFAAIRLVINGNFINKVRKYNNCTIAINCNETQFIDFQMNKEKKKEFINSGYIEINNLYNNYIKNVTEEILNNIITKIE
jgi:predicted acylesterase/phospholipase RssA